MTKSFSKLIIGGGAFILGVLLGPVLMAALAGLNAKSNSDTHIGASYRLLSAFDDRYPQLHLYSMHPGAVARDCGYDEQAFSDDYSLAEGQNWTPFTGYFDLTLWLSKEFHEEVKRRRAEQLSKHLNDFGLAFLDRCLRQSVFAPLCGDKVRKVLEEGGDFSTTSLRPDGAPFEQKRRGRTICTYLDGVAAQNGLKLAQQPR